MEEMLKENDTADLPAGRAQAQAGSQTLLRGLEIIDAVANGAAQLPAIMERVGTTRSTTHRLAAALVQQGYLKFEPRAGYTLGVKLIELGFRAHRQSNLPQIARPVLEQLAAETLDTIHLAVLQDREVIYLDKVSGQRALEFRSRIGGRQPVWSTGVGKALLLDHAETEWRHYFGLGMGSQGQDEQGWIRRMREYAAGGYALDLEDNEPQVRCIAAPVRDVTGKIVAAVSVSSTVTYMDDDRMASLIPRVRQAAAQISANLGWQLQPS